MQGDAPGHTVIGEDNKGAKKHMACLVNMSDVSIAMVNQSYPHRLSHTDSYPLPPVKNHVIALEWTYTMVHTSQRRRKHYEPEPRKKYTALNDTALYILERVYRRRFLTTAHVLMLIEARGGSLQQARWLLRDLMDAGYLMRIKHPQKRKQNAGSYSLIYAISNAGADALKAEGGIPRDHVDWNRRNPDVNDPKTGKGIRAVPHTSSFPTL